MCNSAPHQSNQLFCFAELLLGEQQRAHLVVQCLTVLTHTIYRSKCFYVLLFQRNVTDCVVYQLSTTLMYTKLQQLLSATTFFCYSQLLHHTLRSLSPSTHNNVTDCVVHEPSQLRTTLMYSSFSHTFLCYSQLLHHTLLSLSRQLTTTPFLQLTISCTCSVNSYCVWPPHLKITALYILYSEPYVINLLVWIPFCIYVHIGSQNVLCVVLLWHEMRETGCNYRASSFSIYNQWDGSHPPKIHNASYCEIIAQL